jgi:hypothetical protein
MLTSIYYYDYYKPYILKTNGINKTTQKNRFSGIKTNDYVQNNESSAYFLNRSDKNEIKSLVSGISDNVNAVKDTARYLQSVTNAEGTKYDNAKSAYGDGLEDFVSDCNNLASFASSADLNSGISDFKENVSQIVSDNEETFSKVGISIDDGTLTFDTDVYENLSDDEYNELASTLNDTFSQVYNEACDFLSKPMSSHLNFKNLDYYYNYSYASKDKAAFRLLETGLIVDIAL